MPDKNHLLGGRYQFIQVLGTKDLNQTLLVADVQQSGHPKCVLKQIRLPTHNPTTLRFILSLLKKKLEVLKTVGQDDRIPETFAFFEDRQNFYLVQEFIPGRSLQSELEAGNPWPENKLRAVLRAVLEILVFLQENGVTHGNLKPTNIIRHQKTGQLILLDFSLLKDLSREVTGRAIAENGRLPEDWVYMPQEQRQGRSRFCSDHYALGIIAVQAATGLPASKIPDADDPEVHRKLKSLLQTAPDLSPETIHFIEYLVAPQSDHRSQKAKTLLRALTTQHAKPLKTKGSLPLSAPASPLPLPTPPTPVAAAPAAPSPSPSPGRRWGWVGLGLAAVLSVATALVALRVPQRLWAYPYWQQAQVATAAGDDQQALAAYDRVLALRPNHSEARAARGQLYADQGDLEAALADLSEAIALDPTIAEWRYQRGNVRFAAGDVQGAIDGYTEAIRQDGSFVKAYLNRGTARAEWGDDQGAVEDYTQALALDMSPETQAAAYLNRCLSYSNLEQQGQALSDCSEAINLRPSHELAYENRGLVRRRLGDFQGAIQDYNIAIQIAPDSPHPYYNRALARQELGDLSGAMADFSQAIALDPEYIFAFYDRGLLRAQMGEREEAISDLETAAQQCLDLGRVQCYEDAQYQIEQLQPLRSDSEPSVLDSPEI
jgi:tetratricopeptide (TPR) repeat protein